MKLKLNQTNAIKTATLGVSAASGALVSKGAMSYAPAAMQKPLSKGIIGVIALVAASTITGTGTVKDVSQGLLVGVGIQQTLEAVAGVAKDGIAKMDSESGVTKFLAASVNGLAGTEGTNNVEFPTGAWDRISEPAKIVSKGFAAI